MLVFRSSADALVRHRPHCRLRLFVVSPTSTAQSPEAAEHAATRRQKLIVFLIRVALAATFQPVFGPSPAAVLCHRPYHRLRLTVTIPTSPDSLPEASPRAVTRLLKIEDTAVVDLLSPSTVQIVPCQRSCSFSPDAFSVVGSVFPFHGLDSATCCLTVQRIRPSHPLRPGPIQSPDPIRSDLYTRSDPVRLSRLVRPGPVCCFDSVRLFW
ncbi:hypothetical protein PIB30_037433 [Stylosanthes scabra]|uniref:Uncharacterized protein n=1 Tax=Stylosanthes scabra TaxID=79078 RepID=A0ABU6RDT7_9FABA|nr:hypothetical protein [Stylosanthes scabra]